MKRTLLCLVLSISIFVCSGQSFNGVPISGDLPTCISRFKGKGFLLDKYLKNGAIMNGRINGESVELYIFVTPKTRKVCKVVIYFEEKISWYSLKRQYENMVELLTDKYGTPDDRLATFLDPYYDGDGFELQAIGLEKAIFVAYWAKRNNLNVAVEMSKFKQVSIAYENDIAMDISKKEYEMINKEIF